MNDQDFKKLLLQLQPQGLAWNKTEGSNLSKLVAGEAKEFARVDAYLEKVLREICPFTTTELIEEWADIALGDDQCVKQLTTAAEKKMAVLAQLQAQGGADAVYFQNVAKAAGFLIAVTDGFQQFRSGASRSGDRVLADGFAYTWEVRSPANTVRYFRSGTGRSGDPIVYFGNALLECIIRRLKPAHTEVIFRYQDVYQQLAGNIDISVSMSGAPTVTRFLSGNSDITVNAALADSWTPEYLEYLILWLDAEEFNSNAAVESWTNKAGYRNALQPESGNQPASVTNVINGRSVVRFVAGDQLQVKQIEQFNANNGLHFFAICDVDSGGGILFDRTQLKLTATNTKQEAEILTTSYRSNLPLINNFPDGSGVNGVVVFQDHIYCTGQSFGMYKLNNDGTWTNVLSGLTSAAPRGRMIIVDDKIYCVSSTVNKMYIWDGTTGSEHVNTVNASADLSDLAYNEDDGLIYVADQHNHKLLAFDPSDNTWSQIGTGASGANAIAVDPATGDVYVNKRSGGGGDVFKWDGSSFASEGLSGINNPSALAWIQGTLWLYDQTTGKVTNKANSYTLSGAPEFLFLNPRQMFEADGMIWMASDGNYFHQLARYVLDGTDLNADGWLKNQVGALDLIAITGNAGYSQNMTFIPDTNNLEMYLSGGGKGFQRIERKRFVSDNESMPDRSIIYFGIYNNKLQISINGELVQNVTFLTETYQNPNILLEQIAITNGSLVTFLDDLVTINPANDLPENAVIEIVVDPGAVTDWDGIDDWTFETGVS